MVIITTNVKFFLKNFTGKLYDDIDCYFYKNSYNHRYYGPASFQNNKYFWFFNNDRYGIFEFGDSDYNYSQKKFLKDLDKQWLL